MWFARAILAAGVVALSACGASTGNPSVGVADDPIEPVVAEDRNGEFVLTIHADDDSFPAGEPIDVHAELTYMGDAPEIEVWGSGSGLVTFSVRQVDGEFRVGGASTDDCASYTLARGEPLVVPFQKSGGWDPQDPGSAAIRNFLEDPLLRFPAGEWELFAQSDFLVGDCALPVIDLMASIVISAQ